MIPIPADFEWVERILTARIGGDVAGVALLREDQGMIGLERWMLAVMADGASVELKTVRRNPWGALEQLGPSREWARMRAHYKG